ncbi:MAG: TIR domain-containing protein [Anaerolineae bacterium]|nr:TIR domain-containing protein [Anaerolineae bacterium]
MKHIFLSYSRKNLDVMQKVRDQIRSNGLQVWTDEALEPGTTSWMSAIENALESAACLVVILSPDAKSSRYVREEMNYAEAHDVRIFPVLAVGTEATAVPFGFITAQWVDLRKAEEFDVRLQHLISAIRGYIGVESQQPEKSEAAAEIKEATSEALPPIDLINLSPEAAKAVEILRDPNSKWWRRADAARRLGQLGDSAAVPILEAYLDSADLDVRTAAEKAIDQIRNPGKTNVVSKLAASLPAKPIDTDPLKQLFLLLSSEFAPTTPSAGIQTVKIVITGASDSGKTEFIRSISEIEIVTTDKSVDPKDDDTAIAMDFGRVTITDDLVLYLFSTPGYRQVSSMWEILVEGMQGFIVMVDSSNPKTFHAAKSMLEGFRAYVSTPYVIAANKQDKPDALKVDDLRAALQIEENIKVIPCVAHDKKSVQRVILELLYSIVEEMK